jgi:hypothetical protein
VDSFKAGKSGIRTDRAMLPAPGTHGYRCTRGAENSMSYGTNLVVWRAGRSGNVATQRMGEIPEKGIL